MTQAAENEELRDVVWPACYLFTSLHLCHHKVFRAAAEDTVPTPDLLNVLFSG